MELERSQEEPEEGWDDEEEWDPNRADDPDYDLSEAAGYAGYDSSRQFPSRTLVVIVSLVLLAILLAPFLLRLLR
jgi:adenine-specific DNA methylase